MNKEKEATCKKCGQEITKHSFLSLSCPCTSIKSNGIGFEVNSIFELEKEDEHENIKAGH